jgi:hypothetical protein
VAISKEQTNHCSSDVEEMKGVESTPSADDNVDDAEGDNENQDFSGDYGDFDYAVDDYEVMEVDEEVNNNEYSISDKNSPYVIELKAPSKNEDPALKTSQKLFAISRKNKVARNTYDEIIDEVNDHIKAYYPNAPKLYSYYRSRQAALKDFPIEGKEYFVCKNGCTLHLDGGKVQKCNNVNCELSRIVGTPESMAQFTRKMKYLPLIDQLALLVSDKKTLELMKNPKDKEKKEGVIYSFNDAEIGEIIPVPYSKKRNRLTLCLGLYNDGFQVFKNGKHTMTVFLFVVLNLPESIRTENKYMLQVCCAPGPKAPSDFFSFVEPIKQELEILQSTGFIIKGSDMVVKGHVIFAGGDIPAASKIAGHAGATHTYPCRNCLVKVVKVEKKNTLYPPKNLDIRSKESFAISTPSLGQKHSSPFSTLQAFHSAFYHPIDLMHLFGCNLAPQIAQFMTTDLFNGINAKKGEVLYLQNGDISRINNLLRASCLLVLTTFSGVCESLDGGYKRAVEWLHFLADILNF